MIDRSTLGCHEAADHDVRYICLYGKQDAAMMGATTINMHEVKA